VNVFHSLFSDVTLHAVFPFPLACFIALAVVIVIDWRALGTKLVLVVRHV